VGRWSGNGGGKVGAWQYNSALEAQNMQTAGENKRGQGQKGEKQRAGGSGHFAL
jgi:hypothetical protein